MHFFPVEINTADYEMILRVPGIGVKSAKKIVMARRFAALTTEHLLKIGVVFKRARYFITCNGKSPDAKTYTEEVIRRRILFGEGSVRNSLIKQQLNLFGAVS